MDRRGSNRPDDAKRGQVKGSSAVSSFLLSPSHSFSFSVTSFLPPPSHSFSLLFIPQSPPSFSRLLTPSHAFARLWQVKGSSSVTSRFAVQMSQLMAQLRSAEPLYVRCIKPNAAQKAKLYEQELVSSQVLSPMISPDFPNPPASSHELPPANLVSSQLHCLGVMETVRIRRSGFPVRLPFKDIWAEYSDLAPRAFLPQGATERDKCEAVLSCLPSGLYQMGKTRAFLRDDGPKELMALLATFRAERATAIQARARASS